MADTRDTCDWCGKPGPYFEDEGHDAWFCSRDCNNAWHHEWEEERRAEQIEDLEAEDSWMNWDDKFGD